MPHVTYFRFKAKPGERDAVIKSLQNRTQVMKAKGFQRAVVTSNNEDKDEFLAAVMFDTTENYNANSDNPDTSKWFQELRPHLVADPDWFNGTLEFIEDA
ncbi:MAG: antibiotic biosynthesis monooxygenase [Dehalococcoidia bacterium]